MSATKARKKISLAPMRRWKPPKGWLRITAIDVHTGGEPFRVITGGVPDLPGDTILAKRRWVKERFDHLRTALMWEPRGHADMYGCILTPPVTITAHARVAEGEVKSVRFQNVPSFVLAMDETVDVPGLGAVRCDIAFGGAFYAYVEAKDAGVRCIPDDFRLLIEKGMAIKRAVMAARPIPHPFEADLSFLYGTIFVGPPMGEGAHSRNVCIFAEGEVDRSPTGTGVSGRLAIHHARGDIGIGERIAVESITGSRFTGRVLETTTFGNYPAVIPEVEGAAHICGRQEFLIDPTDPFRDGFILR